MDAASKQEAVAKVLDEPGELLEFVSVVLQAESPAGWRTSLLKQLAGGTKK